jgi:hypothetical protein
LIKKQVVSWDLTEGGLSEDDVMALDGTCKQCPAEECHVIRQYGIGSEDQRLVELITESSSRFKDLASERYFSYVKGVEKKHGCLKCDYRFWPEYRRYIRALPKDEDTRWV